MKRTVYESNFKKLMELCPELSTLRPGSYRFSESPGFMNLNLDVLDRRGNILTVALSHYYKHDSGDLIPDPDMEIRIDLKMGTVEALTFQDCRLYQMVYPEPGKYNPRLKKNLNDFLSQWLRNCRMQGHSLVLKKEEVNQ